MSKDWPEVTLDMVTKVTVQDAVTISRDGEVVGRLDATYDLKNLPEDLHDYALLMIRQGRNLVLPTLSRPSPMGNGAADVDYVVHVKEQPKKRSWFRRLILGAA